MNAGAYRWKVRIQKVQQEYDEIGNPKSEWKDWKYAYAYANGLSGREYWEAANTHQEDTVEFLFRWYPFFDQINSREYRLVFQNEIYDIKYIANLQYRNRTVKIKAVVKDEAKN